MDGQRVPASNALARSALGAARQERPECPFSHIWLRDPELVSGTRDGYVPAVRDQLDDLRARPPWARVGLAF